MNITVAKVISAVLIAITSGAFGYIPSMCTSYVGDLSTHDKNSKKNIVMAFLLNFGGGVLLANCFCHWLPEVREGIAHKHIDTFLPLAEIIMCIGFFVVCFLEQVIHTFVLKNSKGEIKKSEAMSTKEKEVLATVTTTPDMEMNKEGNKSVITAIFVVASLSYHSTIAGLALGLENLSLGVWMNFGAIAMHKFVIAFSIGVELVSSKASKTQYFVSITVFSLAPAVGIAIGIVIMEYKSGGIEIDDFPLQVMQGLATGAILYVVFFEIFPKGAEIGGNGFGNISAMLLGFVVFLPSLYFHEHPEHNKTGVH